MKYPDPLTPATLDELCGLIRQYPSARVVAGGTDLIVKTARRPDGPGQLIDLSGIEALKGIEATDREVIIGAMETMTAITGHPLLNRLAPALTQAAGRVGSWQIRNRATVGGNLVNSSPAADTPPALAALEATAKVLSPQGWREISVADIPAGPNRSNLAPDEILVGLHLPLAPGRLSAFAKIGSRSDVSISRLNLAIGLDLDAAGAVSRARVFMGTLGSAARPAPGAEAALLTHGLGSDEALGLALAEMAAEAIPGRGTLAYKQSAARALALDVLAELRRQAAEGNLLK